MKLASKQLVQSQTLAPHGSPTNAISSSSLTPSRDLPPPHSPGTSKSSSRHLLSLKRLKQTCNELPTTQATIDVRQHSKLLSPFRVSIKLLSRRDQYQVGLHSNLTFFIILDHPSNHFFITSCLDPMYRWWPCSQFTRAKRSKGDTVYTGRVMEVWLDFFSFFFLSRSVLWLFLSWSSQISLCSDKPNLRRELLDQFWLDL